MLTGRRSAALLAGLVLMGLAGCASLMSEGRVSWKAGAEGRPEQIAYQEVLEPYVKEASIYNGMATQLMCSVLPLNKEVRAARARRVAAARGWDQARTQRSLQAALAEHEQYYQVMVSVYLPEAEQNNLADKKPEWLVYLEDSSGNQTPPSDRRRITGRSSLNQALYPFWGLWDNLYVFGFPKSAVAAGGKARLLITGAAGRAELEIELQ